MSEERWVETWVSTPQPTRPDQLPPPPFIRDCAAFVDSTLRQTVRASVGGPRVRLRFANTFGTAPLRLTAVSVALPRAGAAGVSAIVPGSARQVTFHGGRSVTVPAGGEIESDPLEFAVTAGANVTVTIHVADGLPAAAVTSHPGSRTTSYLTRGDRVGDTDLSDAAAVDHWYFLSALRVAARPNTSVLVAVGDSLTDGRGSTTNHNDRWPDLLSDRLRAHPDTADVAVLNHGVGGSRLLDDGRGPGAVDRVVAGALARPALRWLVLFKGVNDLGGAPATRAAQQRVAADLVAAYDRIVGRLREHGVRVYGGTLLPFGGHADYDDPHGHREAARQLVNEWVRGSGRFDEVLDFDRAVRDPVDPRRLAAGFDEGDHLHLNPAGYRALADAVPVHLFTRAG